MDVLSLSRHGPGHRYTPHQINYRANVWALRELGAEGVIATFTVGGISAALTPGTLVLPDQVIDYTWGRAHTFDLPGERHVEFSDPFDEGLRRWLAAGAGHSGLEVVLGGTYGATQGPRLETAAEIDRLDGEGCSVVGMTAMPEAALARELDLPYVALCLVVNPAAGRGAIDREDWAQVGERGMRQVAALIERCLELGPGG
jgi:purine nucleoside phosphorylase|tara:strand:- start:4091 stop:4693 length:603 start_codon:yes stop_codon:yes gene_type:complete